VLIDRLFGLRKRAATGEHDVDMLCTVLQIEHRRRHRRPTVVVERFKGRIEGVLQSHHFRSGEELEATLHQLSGSTTKQLPQSAFGSKAPLQAVRDWHKLRPELFKKQPYFQRGCDR
jgi:hypothetical protein